MVAHVLIAFFGLLGCNFEGERNLGSDYYLLGDGSNTSICRAAEGYEGVFNSVVLGKIVDYDFNDQHIIILRNASDKFKVYFENQEKLWDKQKGIDTIQYWIIVKNKNIIKGPLKKVDFIKESNNLELSKDLVLDESNLF